MKGIFDIAVLGGTPAGCAAAYRLAGRKRSVVLVDAPRNAAESPLADWAPAGFFRLSGLPKSLAGLAGAQPFRRVRYHDAKMNREAEYRSRGQAGYFLQTRQLVRALSAAASRSGVTIRKTRKPPEIRLEEDIVRLGAAGQIRAKVLLIAHNCPSDVIAELALPARTVPQGHLISSGLDVPLSARAAGTMPAGCLHMVELPERSDLGMFFICGRVLHLRVVSASASAGTPAAELSGMIAGLQRERILPADIPLGRARGAIWRPPAGVALELETHVAKRCLLTGTAGGFADSITGQTLMPTVQAALIAADVAHEALKRKDVQTALMRYATLWRKSLAACLQPPSTSLHMLLPLLFINQQIVTRLTRALLYGENI